jgi:hypothetical protein
MDSTAYSIAYNVIYKIKMENDSINKINKIQVKETKL